MSVYQFCRIESFSRSGSSKKKSKAAKQFKNWTASDVIAEAVRDPQACPHVENPKPPKIEFGSVEALTDAIDDYAKNTKTASGRKLRTDALVLGSFVASYPSKKAGPDYEDWKKATLEFVKEKWGDRLRFAVEHLDESNPHCHYFLVENAGTEFRLDPVKDAHRRATESARLDGKSDKEASLTEKNNAAIEAGEALSLEYFEKVSKHFGHFKDAGPNARRRKPRDQYLAEQQALKALEQSQLVLAKANEEAKNILDSVEPLKVEAEKAKTFLTHVETTTKAMKQAALKMHNQAKNEKREVERLKGALEASDPLHLKRTLGRFFVQCATRLVLMVCLLIARPRQTQLRGHFLKARKEIKKLKEKNTHLEIQRDQLERQNRAHLEEKKDLREKLKLVKAENFELLNQVESLTPKPKNVFSMPQKMVPR